MIVTELEKIVTQEKAAGLNSLYIQNLLKEYLQVYVLYFIYTSPGYQKNLIFTGGTCLRHFFGLERLSIDIDFDYLKDFDLKQLQTDLVDFFKIKYQYTLIQGSLKNRQRQLLLKFPVLHQLGLASREESDFLYIKIDMEKNPSSFYLLETTSKSKYGFNFAAKHFDLASLMAGKIHAVLMRDHYTEKTNRPIIKGRDYFDLLWFLKKGVVPNMQRLCDMLHYQVILEEVEERLDEKVVLCTTKFKNDFEEDLRGLIRNQDIIKDFVDNYYQEYLRNKSFSFSRVVNLEVICQSCQKKFYSGIQIKSSVFESMELQKNIHECPFCKYKNVLNKADYILKPLNLD